MTEVISVRFRGGCKNYDFSPRDLQIKMGDQVIVETSQGLEFATCTEGNHDVDDEAVVQPLCAVVRMATENDVRTVEYNRKRESEAFDICEKKIVDHGLEMKLVNVNCSFDGNKIIFFFTADGRVDFRELVRDLASVFRARIELRQIGVRDEAKMIGGLGICGRPFCCSQFLDSFLPVSIKMAKTQNLSLNPTKISGTCGRLMCCLKYEQNAYEDAVKRMPKQDSFVQTPDGPGNVRSVDLLRERAKVSLDSAPESPKVYHNCELCVLRNGKGSREGIEIPAERPARYVEPQAEESFSPLFYGEAISQPEPKSIPSVPEAAEEEKKPSRRRSRGHRGGRGGAKPEGEKSAAGGKPEGEKGPRTGGGKPDGEKRPPRKPRPQTPGQQAAQTGEKPAGNGSRGPRKPDAPKAPRPAAPGETGENREGAARRRPRHRGGRRRGHGGGEGGGTPPSAE